MTWITHLMNKIWAASRVSQFRLKPEQRFAWASGMCWTRCPRLSWGGRPPEAEHGDSGRACAYQNVKLVCVHVMCVRMHVGFSLYLWVRARAFLCFLVTDYVCVICMCKMRLREYGWVCKWIYTHLFLMRVCMYVSVSDLWFGLYIDIHILVNMYIIHYI